MKDYSVTICSAVKHLLFCCVKSDSGVSSNIILFQLQHNHQEV